MITLIAEHSVNLDLLPEKANILDLGCRGFLLANYFRKNHNVVCVDIDEFEGEYDRCAISNYTGKCGIKRTNDPQATSIADGNEIPCYTLEDYSHKAGVPFWDLIKMDIEGSEYEVIMSLTAPPAKQLSIEFHLHTGIYSRGFVIEMLLKLTSLGYIIIKHDLTAQHGAGFNYWSSLFILE